MTYPGMPAMHVQCTASLTPPKYIVAHDVHASLFVLRINMKVPAQLCVVTSSFIFLYYGLTLYIVSASICVHVHVCVCACVCVCMLTDVYSATSL